MTCYRSLRHHFRGMAGRLLALAVAQLVLVPGGALAEPLTGLTSTGSLVTFDSSTPGTIGTSVAITGLAGGETILGIDRRPANGLLYGLGSTSRLYTLNTTTGLATSVGASPFSPALTGTAFGFDFNPVPDRIRVVSTDTSNVRLNPNDGTVAGTDTALSYAAGDSGAGISPRVVGSAYTNNFNGTSVTTLFGIDSNRDVLVMQGGPHGVPSPSRGVLTTIGTGLGFNTSDLVGFDVSGITGTAFASLVPPTGGAAQLFTINVATGTATLVGTIGTGLTLTGLAAGVGAAPTIPEPSSLFLLAAGGLVLTALARRRRACVRRAAGR